MNVRERERGKGMKEEMGNGKWEMGNGKWEMENGKWEMVPKMDVCPCVVPEIDLPGDPTTSRSFESETDCPKYSLADGAKSVKVEIWEQGKVAQL